MVVFNVLIFTFDVDFRNPHVSALHHLKELTTVYSKLKPGCLIVVDDNHNGLGKGQYVADFLSNVNDRLYFNEYQIGYIKLWFLIQCKTKCRDLPTTNAHFLRSTAY